MEEREPLVHPTVKAPVDQPEWLLAIVGHIVALNHELGDVVRDLAWVKRIVKAILIVLVLLGISLGDELLEVIRKALDLLA